MFTQSPRTMNTLRKLWARKNLPRFAAAKPSGRATTREHSSNQFQRTRVRDLSDFPPGRRQIYLLGRGRRRAAKFGAPRQADERAQFAVSHRGRRGRSRGAGALRPADDDDQLARELSRAAMGHDELRG